MGQDQADRAYNKLISNNIIVRYAQLRNGNIIELNPLGPCFGGQICPAGQKLAPMDINVVGAWLDADKKVLWRRPPKPPESKKSLQPPPPPAPKRKTVREDHIIYTKIAEGQVTKDDFNALILEAMPESVRDRVRRRMKTNVTDAHQDEEGHQQLNLPNFNDRIQPKRKPSGRSQMNGRGRIAHRHSSRTQEKTMAKSFSEAAMFIKNYMGRNDYHDKFQLIEDKRALGLLVIRMMGLPNVDRDWLSEIANNCSVRIGI